MLLKTISTFCTLRPLRAGGVLVRNPAGIFLRNNAIPIKKVSNFNQPKRLSFFQASQLLKGLSSAELAEWQSARARYSWTDPCGNSFTPDVPELFTSLNIPMFNFGLVPYVLPPISTSVPVSPSFRILELTDHSFVLGMLGGPIPAHHILQIFALPGGNYPQHDIIEKYVIIGSFPDTTLSSFSIFNQYFYRYGQPHAGQYIRLASRYFFIDSALFSDYVFNVAQVS